MLRREALMQMGVVEYVHEAQMGIGDALRAADRILACAASTFERKGNPAAAALQLLRRAAREAGIRLADGEPVAEVTYGFQQAVDAASRQVVDHDLAAIRADLAALAQLPMQVDGRVGHLLIDDLALARLADREWSPLGAIESVQSLVRAIEVDPTTMHSR